MKKRRVLIVGSNMLLVDAIWRLLENPEIERIGPFVDKSELIEQITRLEPDIIVWEGESEIIELNIQVLELVHHKMRIIKLNSNNNEVNVYASEPGNLNTTQDLLQMILKE